MSPLNFDGVSCLMESSKNVQTWLWLSKAKIWFLIFSVFMAHLWKTVWRKYKYASQQSFKYQTILSIFAFFSTFFLITPAIEWPGHVLKRKIAFILSVWEIDLYKLNAGEKVCSIWMRLFSSRTRKPMSSLLMEATSTQRERVLV